MVISSTALVDVRLSRSMFVVSFRCCLLAFLHGASSLLAREGETISANVGVKDFVGVSLNSQTVAKRPLSYEEKLAEDHKYAGHERDLRHQQLALETRQQTEILQSMQDEIGPDGPDYKPFGKDNMGDPVSGGDWQLQAKWNEQNFPRNAFVYTFRGPWEQNDADEIQAELRTFNPIQEAPVLWIHDIEDGPFENHNLHGTLAAIKMFHGWNAGRGAMIIVGKPGRWPRSLRPGASLLEVVQALHSTATPERISAEAFGSTSGASIGDLSSYKLKYMPTVYAFDDNALPKWNGFFERE